MRQPQAQAVAARAAQQHGSPIAAQGAHSQNAAAVLVHERGTEGLRPASQLAENCRRLSNGAGPHGTLQAAAVLRSQAAADAGRAAPAGEQGGGLRVTGVGRPRAAGGRQGLLDRRQRQPAHQGPRSAAGARPQRLQPRGDPGRHAGLHPASGAAAEPHAQPQQRLPKHVSQDAEADARPGGRQQRQQLSAREGPEG